MVKQEIEQTILDHWSEFKRLMRHLLHDSATADDALQTAFLKVLTTTSSPRSHSKIVPWFKSILKNTALDIHRKQSHHQSSEWEEEMSSESSPDDIDDPACQCVIKLLSQLSVEDQTVLKQLDIDDIPLQQVAATMNISANTLKVRRHRARKRLKERVIKVCQTGARTMCDECHC